MITAYVTTQRDHDADDHFLSVLRYAGNILRRLSKENYEDWDLDTVKVNLAQTNAVFSLSKIYSLEVRFEDNIILVQGELPFCDIRRIALGLAQALDTGEYVYFTEGESGDKERLYFDWEEKPKPIKELCF